MNSDEIKFVFLLYELVVDFVLEVDESEWVLDFYFKKDFLIVFNLVGKLKEEDI